MIEYFPIFAFVLCAGILTMVLLRWLHWSHALAVGVVAGGLLTVGVLLGTKYLYEQHQERVAREAGFPDATSYQAAQRRGLTSYADYSAQLQRERDAAAKAAARAKEHQQAVAAAAAAKAAAEKREAEAACRKDPECHFKPQLSTAQVTCQDAVEGRAQYHSRWTDSWYELKFPRIGFGRSTGVVVLGGDRVEFQNGFGAWATMSYLCHYDTAKKRVVKLDIARGRL